MSWFAVATFTVHRWELYSSVGYDVGAVAVMLWCLEVALRVGPRMDVKPLTYWR